MRKGALIVASILWTFSAMAVPIDALVGIWCGPDISYEFWKDRLIVRNKDKVSSVKMIDHVKAEGEGELLVYWAPFCPDCATLFVIAQDKLTEVGQSEINLYRCGSVRDKSETPKRD
jgi:hypothetical protein